MAQAEENAVTKRRPIRPLRADRLVGPAATDAGQGAGRSAPGRWATRSSRTWPCWAWATGPSGRSRYASRTRTSRGPCSFARTTAGGRRPRWPRRGPPRSIPASASSRSAGTSSTTWAWASIAGPTSILGGLDNREARVAINRGAARAGKIWIDGAIERLDGVARVFDPACGPCYECTMNEIDWKMLAVAAKLRAAVARRDGAGQGAHDSTTASVIAGIQCQEAVKLIHGLDDPRRTGLRVRRHVASELHRGLHAQGRLPFARSRRPGRGLAAGRGPDARRRIPRTGALRSGPQCGDRDQQRPARRRSIVPFAARRSRCWASLGQVSERRGRCPRCGQQRVPNMFHTIDGREPFLDRTLGEIGVPPWDVLAGRAGLGAALLRIRGRPGGGSRSPFHLRRVRRWAISQRLPTSAS